MDTDNGDTIYVEAHIDGRITLITSVKHTFDQLLLTPAEARQLARILKQAAKEVENYQYVQSLATPG